MSHTRLLIQAEGKELLVSPDSLDFEADAQPRLMVVGARAYPLSFRRRVEVRVLDFVFSADTTWNYR